VTLKIPMAKANMPLNMKSGPTSSNAGARLMRLAVRKVPKLTEKAASIAREIAIKAHPSTEISQ
jgi:hypothetical protein